MMTVRRTPFLQSIQTWKWKVLDEERKQYAKKVWKRVDVVEKDLKARMDCEVDDVVELIVDTLWKIEGMDSEDQLIIVKKKAKIVVKFLNTLLSCERMKRLSLHHLMLKERMKDCTINYIDLFHLDLLLATSDVE